MTSSSDSLGEFVIYAQDSVTHLWGTLSAGYPNLHDLPSNLEETIRTYYDKLTLGGSLPTPDWKLLTPAAPVQVVVKRGIVAKTLDRLQQRPFLTLFVSSSIVGATIICLYPAAVRSRALRLATPLRPYIPLLLLPTSDRPLRTTTQPGGAEIRKEAVLILGAGGAGRELALDFEKRGFVVICTVRRACDVEALERAGRGHMKVLVLDDSDATSVAPFLRSLTTALSLRFPLHSSGDPYSRPSHALALTTVVNCLALTPNGEGLRPIEGMEIDEVQRGLGEKLATVVGVLRGVMPILRTMAGRPSAPQGTIVTLVPSTSAVALPFLSLASAADTALLSLLDSFRRELALTSSNIRLVSLEVGFFVLATSAATLPVAQPFSSSRAPLLLSARLSSIYAPALSRRRYLGSASTSEAVGGRKGTPIAQISQKVFNIVVYGRGGSRSRVGAGSLTYRFTSLLPNAIIDSFLSLQDRLVSLLFSHRVRLLAAQTPEGPDTPSQAAAASSHLPPHPAGLPDYVSRSAEVDTSSLSGSGYASEESEEVEDAASQGNNPASFSFVGSEADWREQR